MTERDVLQRAAAALRERTGKPCDDAELTKARVLSDLQRVQRRRRRAWAIVLPIAAVFVGAAAWASSAGYTERWWNHVAKYVVSSNRKEAPPEDAWPAPRGALPAPSMSAAIPLVPSVSSESTVEESLLDGSVRQAEPTQNLNSRHTEHRSGKHRSVSNATPKESDADASTQDGRADDAYRKAHDLHFVEQDASRALAAWDAYLQLAPSGRFAPEARYNRALCLIRLGRRAEALDALRPFAHGAYGTYRMKEAQELGGALETER